MKKLKEDNELTTVSANDIEELNIEDLDIRIRLLADYLEINPFNIEESDYGRNYYTVYDDDIDGDPEYLVLTDSEADEYVEEYAKDDLLCNGFDTCGLDVNDYISRDYKIESMEEYYRYQIEDMSEKELIDELLSNNELSLSDTEWFELKDDVDTQDEYFDTEDPSNYNLIRSKGDLEDLLYDLKTADEDELEDEFSEMGMGYDVDEYVRSYFREHNCFPYFIDEDEAVKDLTNYSDRGNTISVYDGHELELGEDDRGVHYYAYRTD